MSDVRQEFVQAFTEVSSESYEFAWKLIRERVFATDTSLLRVDRLERLLRAAERFQAEAFVLADRVYAAEYGKVDDRYEYQGEPLLERLHDGYLRDGVVGMLEAWADHAHEIRPRFRETDEAHTDRWCKIANAMVDGARLTLAQARDRVHEESIRKERAE